MAVDSHRSEVMATVTCVGVHLAFDICHEAGLFLPIGVHVSSVLPSRVWFLPSPGVGKFQEVSQRCLERVTDGGSLCSG